MRVKTIVAIDGPAGAGKSTIAKLLAKRIGADYIDTGAMYRAVALKLIRTGTDYRDGEALQAMLDAMDVDFSEGHTILDGEDVSGLIRTPEISALASPSSGVPAIRYKLTALQQAMGKRKSIVMDGRDIGTVVFPDADFKFFLTASADERARRRTEEMRRYAEGFTLKGGYGTDFRPAFAYVEELRRKRRARQNGGIPLRFLDGYGCRQRNEHG